ncbi:MAG: exo-alpha-sialidase [Gemmatimonadetes bacterium]|jgi:sialidase-1|nr:exo-alpha-sialidase [Gemmatimonadota bacterium]
MNGKIALELNHKRNNPRNSEGAFVTLTDGRILFAYSRYSGKSGSDHGTASIAARYSSDGGRTWTSRDRIIVPNEGTCNVMSVSFLRLRDGRIALFYARKNSFRDCRLRMRTSEDEGKSWSDPVLCIPAPGYFVVNNDRIIQLRNGRIIVPAAYHRARLETDEMQWEAFDGRGIAMFFLSDDGGTTWKESQDWWSLPVRASSGLQEPGVVELSRGRIYAWCRTQAGRQWQFTSRNGGDTWTSPEPSRFRSPCSPLSIKQIPSTGDLLAVWNDASHRSPKATQLRTPLAAAISSNEGKTWRHTRLIEDDPQRGFCYTAIHFDGDAVLLAYCCGGRGGGILQDLCIRRIPLDWFYGK